MHGIAEDFEGLKQPGTPQTKTASNLWLVTANVLRTLFGIAVFLSIWMIGCAVAELWLHLSVAWSMFTGVITYQIARKSCGLF